MSNVLGSLGLSKEEQEIYRVLLVSGQLSGGELRSVTGFDSSIVNDAIQSLETKNLLRRISGLQDRYAALLPVDTAIEKVQESLGSISTLGQKFQEEKESTVEQIRKNSQKILTELYQTLADITEEINSKSEEVDQNLDANSQTIRQTVLSKREEFQKDLNQNRQDLEGRIKDLIQNQTNRIESGKVTFNTKVSESVKSFLEKMHIPTPQMNVDLAEAETTTNTVKEKLEVLTESTKGIVGRQKTIIKDQTDAMKQLVEESFNRLDNNAINQTENLKNTAENIRTSVQSSLDQSVETINHTSSSLENTLKFISETIQNGHKDLSESKTILDQTTEKGIISFHNAISSSFQTNQDHLEQIHTSGSNFVNDANNRIIENLNLLENEFNSLIQQKEVELKQTLENEFERLLQQAKKSIEDMNKNLSATLKQNLESTRNMQKDLKSQTLQTLNQVKMEKNKELKDLEQKQTLKLDELKNHLLSQMESSFNQINSQLNSLQEKITGVTAEAMEQFSQSGNSITANKNQLNETLNQFLNQLGSTLNAVKESLKTEKEDFINRLMTQGSQLETQLDSLLSDIEKDMGTSIQEINSGFGSLKQQISSKVAEANANLNDQIDQLKESIASHLEILKNDFATITETDGVAQKSMVQSFHSDLEELSQRIEALSESLAEKITIENSQLTDMLIAKMKEQNNLIKEKGYSTIEKIKTVASGIGDTQVSHIQNLLDQYVGNFVANSNSLVTNLQGLNESLAGFSKLIDATETPQIKTTTIVGKQAIIEYISDMLGRIKSKATILVPSIEMVDDQKILQLPRTSQVTIVSYIDEITHRDWIDKMHNAPANVTLRAIQKGGLGGTLPDFIGCEREGEEILLGTIDEGNDDYVAIASGSEYFVRILGNIVISDYARGKSRQLPK